MPKENIRIRYTDTADTEKPKTAKRGPGRPKKNSGMSDAQREALEKARAVLREKRKQEREARKQLKAQERKDDEVIMERARRSQALRKAKEDADKRMKELEEQRKLMEEEQKRIDEEAMRIAQEELDAEDRGASPPSVTPQYEEEEEEEGYEGNLGSPTDIVKRVSKPGRKGRRVLVIDSSIFEDDEGVEVEYKRGPRRRKPALKPKPARKKKADKRTRFKEPEPEPEPETDYEEEEEEEEEYNPYPKVSYDDEEDHEILQYQNEERPRVAQAPKPPPVQRKVLTRDQMGTDPLYGMIFG